MVCEAMTEREKRGVACVCSNSDGALLVNSELACSLDPGTWDIPQAAKVSCRVFSTSITSSSTAGTHFACSPAKTSS